MTDQNGLEPDLDLDEPFDGLTLAQLAAELGVLQTEQRNRKDLCGICREHIPTTKNKLFGLQQFCYHKFHYSCTIAWRKKSGLKECPTCKRRSPSVYMWPEHLDERDRKFKAELFDNFLQGVWARQLFAVLDVLFTLFLDDYRIFWMIVTIVMVVLGWFE